MLFQSFRLLPGAACAVLLFLIASCSKSGSSSPFTGSNQSPSVDILAPDSNTSVVLGATIAIQYVDDDPDDVALTDLFAIPTSGGGPSVEIEIANELPERDGAMQEFLWDTSGIPLGSYYVEARTRDVERSVTATSPGAITVEPLPDSSEISYLQGESYVYEAESWPDGAHAVLGNYKDMLILDPNLPTEKILTSDATHELFFGRYAPTGELQWAKSAQSDPDESAEPNLLEYGLSAFPDGALAVGVTHNKRLTLDAGEPTEVTLPLPLHDSSAFVARYGAGGSLEWVSQIISAGDVGLSDVSTDADGSVLVCGRFETEAMFDAGGPDELTLTSEEFESSFVARYLWDGELAWARRVETETSGSAACVVSMGERYAVAGRFDGPARFGNGNSEHVDPPGEGPFGYLAVFRTHHDSLIGLSHYYGPSEVGPTALAQSERELVLYGWRLGEMTVVSASGDEVVLGTDGEEGFLARYEDDATLYWAVSVPSQVHGTPLDVLAPHSDGTVAVVGTLSETSTFGIGDATEVTLTPVGNSDLFMAYYDSNGELYWALQDGGDGALEVLCAAPLPDSVLIGLFIVDMAFFEYLGDAGIAVDGAITPSVLLRLGLISS